MKQKLLLSKKRAELLLIIGFLLGCTMSTAVWANDGAQTTEAKEQSKTQAPNRQYDQPYPITEAELTKKILSLIDLPKNKLSPEKITQVLGITSQGQMVNRMPSTALDWSFSTSEIKRGSGSGVLFSLRINQTHELFPKLYIALEQDIQPSLERQGWVFGGSQGGQETGLHGMNMPRVYGYSKNINGENYGLSFDVGEESHCTSIIQESHCIYSISFEGF